VRALTGYNFFRACLGRGDQVFTLDSCPAGRVIYIASAEVGSSYTWTISNSQCYPDTREYCRQNSYHQEIMQCNGRRHCSFTRNVFNLTCGTRRINFMEINYNCFKGKSTMRTLYDLAFRVYFMICSCRISSSKNCKYWLLSKNLILPSDAMLAQYAAVVCPSVRLPDMAAPLLTGLITASHLSCSSGLGLIACCYNK